jgi:DNA polymerase-1
VELKFDKNNPKYEYITTDTHAEETIIKLTQEEVVGIDIEGTGLDPYTAKLLTIQISSRDTCYVFDARALDLRKLTFIKQFLESNSAIKILHNGKFDYKHIKVHTGIEVANIYDTMLAEVVLNSGLGKGYYSLKDLAFKYLNMTMDKEIRESFINMTSRAKFTDDQLKYAALDALIMFPIFELQIAKLKKENLINIAKLEFAATRAVGDMELYGVHIDVDKWKGIIKDLGEKRDVLAKTFQETIRQYFKSSTLDLFGNIGDSININSNVQLMDLFNTKLHLNLPSTGDAILETADHPVVKILRDYRGYEKLVSAFGENLLEKINKVTKRIHPEFNQLGAATGRFSCNNPNFQQIPRNSEEAPFRTCFCPAPGMKLVVSDYSSMEMRILADLSGDLSFIKAIKEGLDIHSYTASLMFNLPYTSDFKKKYPDKRQAAKVIGFGLMYGMGPSSLARQIGVTPEKGKQYLERYFASYPSIKRFLDKMGKDAIRNGWSSTPAGRKRWYTIPLSSDPDYKKKMGSIERQAKNHPIQGTNADAIKYALVYLRELLKTEKIEGSLILTVHDEIVSEIREDQAERWSHIQAEQMCKAAELFIKKVPIVAEPFISDVWEH